MKSAAAEATSKPDADEATRQSTRPAERQSPRRQPRYAVILHNDDLNTFPFVIGVLQKVFHYELLKAQRLTLEAHETGRSIVWSGMLEPAELKADQVRSCGADPLRAGEGATKLRVTVEPIPGD